MVAHGGTSAYGGAGTSVPPSVLASRGGFVRFTADDVLLMLREGILPEDSSTELFNGLVVLKDRSDLGGDPRMHGPKHRACIRRLMLLAARIEGPGRHAQVQLPVVLADDQMPEPDLAIVRGGDAEYADRLPTAHDTLMVLEAADSSLERDEHEKLPAYAAAGIPQYVILDLRTRSARVYSGPEPSTGTYGPPLVLQEGQTLRLRVGDADVVEVPLADVLP